MELEPSILFWGGVWILRERQKEQIQQQLSWSQLLVSTLFFHHSHSYLPSRLKTILTSSFLYFLHCITNINPKNNTTPVKSLHIALFSFTRWNSLWPLPVVPGDQPGAALRFGNGVSTFVPFLQIEIFDFADWSTPTWRIGPQLLSG